MASIRVVCLLVLTVMALSQIKASTYRYTDKRTISDFPTEGLANVQDLIINFKLKETSMDGFQLQTSIVMDELRHPCAEKPFINFSIFYGIFMGNNYYFTINLKRCEFSTKLKTIGVPIFKYNEFAQIWISWGHGKARMGLGAIPNENTVVERPVWIDFKVQESSFECTKSGDWVISVDDVPVHTGEWEIYRANQWRVNITTGVIWREISENLEVCAVLCHQSDACRSYTYSHTRQICQGHQEKYTELDDVTYVDDKESVYFI